MSLALLIASIVAGTMTTLPGLPAGVATALNAITTSLGIIIKNGIGQGTPVTTNLILATLTGIIQQLRTQPGLPQNVLDDIQLLDNALSAALAADKDAQIQVDPAKLQRIDPLP